MGTGRCKEETQVAGKDRKKELARQRIERQQAHRAEQEAQARRIKIIGGAVAAVVVIAGAGTAFALTRNDSKSATNASTSPSASTSSKPVAAGDCGYTAAQDSGAPKGLGLPPVKPTLHGTVSATIKTNLGDIQLSLDAAKAPCTVNSFAFLASKNYFNNTECHRLTTGQGLQVLQCGDPTGSGAGGPGYKFADENLPSSPAGAYKPGVVAMANAGAGTNGSQFFIIYGDASGLEAKYTPFGTVTKGLDIVQSVAKAGSTPDGDGKPKKKVVIDSFTITK
jgi:peptidyl-prolyl cis-trans isomerase B (cyclophilin B)